jgi:hypothetical protein
VGDEEQRGVWGHFVRGLGESTRTNGLAYGYSIVSTAAFGLEHAFDGGPSVGQCFLFAIGPSLTFAVLGAAVTRGFREQVEREPPLVLAVAVALSLFSIMAALGVTALVAWQLRGDPSWLVAPLAASVVYLLASAIESTFARGVHALAGTEDLGSHDDPAT